MLKSYLSITVIIFHKVIAFANSRFNNKMIFYASILQER